MTELAVSKEYAVWMDEQVARLRHEEEWYVGDHLSRQLLKRLVEDMRWQGVKFTPYTKDEIRKLLHSELAKRGGRHEWD